MKVLRRFLAVICGLFFNLAGLAGSSDQVKNWSHWLGVTHHWLENPLIWIGANLFGIGLLAYTWADYLAERTIATAGGKTKREFRVNFHQWDRLKNFSVWQIAWLWNGLEPYNQETSGTVAYPSFRRLKEDLDAGLIEGAERQNGSWKDTSIGRQALIDYANKIGEKPVFLFPEQRNWVSRQKLRWFGPKEAAKADVKEYHGLWDWYGFVLHTNKQCSIEALKADLLAHLKDGSFVAIGRPVRDGLNWPYVHLPRRMWRDAQFEWNENAKNGGKEYGSIRMKNVRRAS